MNCTTPLLILVLLTAATQAEQMYKWIDVDGVVHYTDRPPPSATPFARIKVGSESNPTTASQNNAPPTTADTPANATQHTISSSPDSPVQRLAKACEQARKQIDLLSSKYEVSVSKDNGQVEVLDSAARKLELIKAQEAASAYCK